ncbi:hypothetical protein JOH50_005953 [Rhizobium leguminosarum]|nr:hypothetical protein [Rhizobium leguminosarum]
MEDALVGIPEPVADTQPRQPDRNQQQEGLEDADGSRNARHTEGGKYRHEGKAVDRNRLQNSNESSHIGITKDRPIHAHDDENGKCHAQGNEDRQPLDAG